MVMRKLFLLLLTTLFIMGCEKVDENDNIKDAEKEVTKSEVNVFERRSLKLRRIVENDTVLPKINLMTDDNPDFFAKTVILFENDKYLVKTNLDLYISTYPFDSKHYSKILERVIKDSKNQDTLIMRNYTVCHNDSSFVLAHHMEKGTCHIYDKINKKIIPEVIMEIWWDIPGPGRGDGGRRFYLKNELFYETYDWVC